MPAKLWLRRAVTSGYTLLEVMTVAAIIGVLAAAATPGFFRFVDNQRLKTASDRAFLAIRDAQTQAIRERERHQVSFRNVTSGSDTISQWAVHPAADDPNTDFVPAGVNWQDFDSGIQIFVPETTLCEDSGPVVNCNGSLRVWRIIFNYRGEIDIATTGVANRKIVFAARSNGNQRCIFQSSLIGHLRTATGTENCD